MVELRKADMRGHDQMPMQSMHMLTNALNRSYYLYKYAYYFESASYISVMKKT